MDFQSAMETFAEAWMSAQVGGKILLGNNNNNNISSTTAGHLQAGSSNCSGTGRDTPIESPLQQQLGSNVDYGKMPSCMDLSSSSSCTTGTTTTTATTTAGGVATLSPVKRLKGVGGSRNPGNSSSPSSSSATCTNIPPTLGKSMPIHCIIEVSNNNNSSGNNRRLGDSMVESGGTLGTNNINSGGGGSTLDIINNMNNNNKDSSSSSTGKVVVEVDDFVIIPAGTPFHEVVTTVLTLLGYPKDIIRQAEGTICLRNWKPLRLDQVCDASAKTVTVGDILNDLTNHATLRVLVTRAKGGTTEDLKEKLLRLLLGLPGAGCPLDEMTMSQLVKGQWPQNLAEDVKRRFNQWYKSLHPGTTLGLLESLQHTHMQQQQQQQVTSNSSSHGGGGGGGGVGGSLIGSNHVGVGSIHHHLVNGSTGGHHHHHANDLSTKSTPFIDDDQNHPVFHGLTTQKTRMRTSFDPEMELPKLQQWFAENPHPSRHQIQQYVRELNSLDCRKDRKPLDVNNVIYWFKNARAAQKRNEIRYNGLSPGHPPSYAHHHHHHHHSQALSVNSHLHLLHSSHSHGEGRNRGEGGGGSSHNQPTLTDMTNGDSGNEHSGDSEDYQDADITKEENEGDRSVLTDMKENDRILRNMKEERDEDYINVDVDNGGHNNGGGEGEATSPTMTTSPRGSPREIKNILVTSTSSTNNNEEPKDLSSSGGKSPQVDSGEDTFDEKPDRSPHHDKDHHHHGSGEGKGKRGGGGGGGEKSQVIAADDNGVDMIRPTDLVGDNSNNSSCSSVSPRSSPGGGGLSPSPHYDFNGPPSMAALSRFHPFFDHPSFMAYRHFNSFNFASNFPGGAGSGTNGSDSYEAALTRKSLLPLGKPDIFHEFPQGLSPSSMVVAAAANGRNGGGTIVSGGGVNCDPLSRLRADELFPPRPASSADIISSIINSNRGDFSPLNLGNHHHHHHHHNSPNSTLDERRKRNRTFIDPVTEVVLLENWFKVQTHPSHNLILKYTEQLNNMPYRQKFPKLEPKNIQFWFKNRRAKCKRLKMTL